MTNKKFKIKIKSNDDKEKLSTINNLSNTSSNKSLNCNSIENNQFYLTDSNFYQNNNDNKKNKIINNNPISLLFKTKNNI